MKYLGGYILAVSLFFASLFIFLPTKVEAEACNNTLNYGAVQLLVPKLSNKGEYQLWVRMQSPVNSGKVVIELNSSECFEVASSLLTPNSWAWVPYYENNKNKSITLDNTKGNIIKIIGVQSSIKVDRVLLTDPNCAPENFGDNCVSSFEPTIANAGQIQEISSSFDGPVQGDVVISATPFTQAATLKSLSYSVNGRTVQVSETTVPFDTTLLENGKYTIIIETRLADGTVIRESTVIVIDNQETVLSPLIRWVRTQEKSLVVAGLGIVGLIAIALIVSIIRKANLKRRERRFHGF